MKHGLVGKSIGGFEQDVLKPPARHSIIRLGRCKLSSTASTPIVASARVIPCRLASLILVTIQHPLSRRSPGMADKWQRGYQYILAIGEKSYLRQTHQPAGAESKSRRGDDPIESTGGPD